MAAQLLLTDAKIGVLSRDIMRRMFTAEHKWELPIWIDNVKNCLSAHCVSPCASAGLSRNRTVLTKGN